MAAMSDKQQWIAVDRYITDLLVPPDAALDAALRASREAGLPEINVSPNQGKLLHLLARVMGARRILEIGTLGGYSAIWLARALPPGDGKLITLEFDPKHAAVAKANVERAGVSDRVELIVGRALDTCPALVARGPFDLIFIDADKPALPEYFTWSLKLARPGGVIVADNVVREGKVIDAANPDASVLGVRRFMQMLAAEPRVDATALQTVGGKGYDGFAIAIVK